MSGLISSDADRLRAWNIQQWLRGRQGFRGEKTEAPINLLPREAILDWVNASPSKHAPQAASFSPPVWEADKWRGSLARILLVNHGENKNVRSALAANYFTEGWWGPQSLHYKERLEQISAILASETDRNDEDG